MSAHAVPEVSVIVERLRAVLGVSGHNHEHIKQGISCLTQSKQVQGMEAIGCMASALRTLYLARELACCQSIIRSLQERTLLMLLDAEDKFAYCGTNSGDLLEVLGLFLFMRSSIRPFSGRMGPGRAQIRIWGPRKPHNRPLCELCATILRYLRKSPPGGWCRKRGQK